MNDWSVCMRVKELISQMGNFWKAWLAVSTKREENRTHDSKKAFSRHFQPVEHVPPVEVGRVEVGPVVEEQVGRGWPGIRGSVGDHAKKIWIGETNRKDSSLTATQPESTKLFLSALTMNKQGSVAPVKKRFDGAVLNHRYHANTFIPNNLFEALNKTGIFQ